MRTVWKITKRLALSILTLASLAALTVVAVATWAYYHPKPAWDFAHRRILPSDLTLSLNQLHFAINKISWKQWMLDCDLEGLQVDKSNPALTVPIDRIHLALTAKLFSSDWSILVEDVTVMAAKSISYRADSEKPSAPIDYQQQLTRLRQELQLLNEKIAIKHVAIELSDIRYSTGNAPPLLLQVSLQKNESQPLQLVAKVQNVSEQVQRLAVRGAVDLTQLDQPAPLARFVLEIRGKGLRSQSHIDLAYQNRTASANVDANLSYRQKGMTVILHPHAQAILNEEALSIKLDTSLAGLPGSIVKLRTLSGEFHLPLKADDKARPATFSIRLPVALYFLDRNLRAPIESSCHCRIPEKLLVEFQGSVWLKALSENSQAQVLQGHLSVEGVKNRLFDLNLAGDVKIRRENDRWRVEPVMASRLIVHSFQGLRHYLDAKNILIPAPLNVLDGEIVLDARAPIQIGYADEVFSKMSTECNLSINLVSPRQKIDLTTKIMLLASDRFQHLAVDANSTIEHLKLELPPFHPIAGIPKFVRDARIQLKPLKDVASKNLKVTLNFTAETASPQAVQLYSELARPYIPLQLKLAQHGDVTDGFVHIEPFKIVYLRRTLSVDSLQLNLKETPGHDFPIIGDFHVDQTDYRVNIHIAGTTNDPQIQLSSDPYLERNDIISVLLYDRTSDELDSGDAETAGNVQAAMADHAIGLLGLWLFAATPIRSFTYNPLTRIYSATVALGNGVTAGVGTNWEQSTMLEVRKRISRRWVVMASWDPSQEDPDRKVGKLTLQWERRF